MSLKFGIYLVEQRIISPEQFCGLVKIQQEATMSPATIALRKNILTIKQVANVLDIAEANPEKSFVNVAMELDLMDRADADQILHIQQINCPSIRKLVVECGLLTQRQTSVLYLHFERNGSNPILSKTPIQKHAPSTPSPAPKPELVQPTTSVVAEVPPPKFQQRPVIIRQNATTNG